MLDGVIPAGNLQRLYNGWREMSRQYYVELIIKIL
jgi:hypothetical protein